VAPFEFTDTTMAEWTRQELEELHPDGTVNVQIDDDVRPMTHEEWSAWIEQQVGTEKLDEVLP